jgi:hypothetical protein
MLGSSAQQRDLETDTTIGKIPGTGRVALISSRLIATAFSGLASGQDVWPGPTPEYALPTAGESWEIVCSNAGDTVGGAGAETVTLTILDTAYNPLATLVVNLNGGTVAVPGGAVNFRLNDARTGAINATGGRRRPLGDITIRQVGTGTVRGIIPALSGTLQQAVYTVPAGRTLTVDNIEAQLLSSGGGTTRGADFLLLFRAPNGSTTAPRMIGTTDARPYVLEAKTKIRVAEKFDFIQQCIYTSHNNIRVGISWEGDLNTN